MGSLSGRLVHLQDALGLGPTWVSRAAQIVPISVLVETPTNHSTPLAKQPASAHSAAALPQPTTPTVQPKPTTSVAEPVAAETVQHHVSKRAAALLAHIAQAQQKRPVSTSAAHSPVANTIATLQLQQDDLNTLSDKIPTCQACDLHRERRQAFAPTVPDTCRLIVVLPHPSLDDDAAGELLSGEAGQMWHNIVHHALKLTSTDIYMTTAIKCAPNVTLVPQQHHAACCSAYLQRELQLLPAAPVLLLAENQRSLFVRLQEWVGDKRVYRIPHPNKMLRNPDSKRGAWETLQQLKSQL